MAVGPLGLHLLGEGHGAKCLKSRTTENETFESSFPNLQLFQSG